MKVQGCKDRVKRECVGGMFWERRYYVLIVIETRLKGRGDYKIGKVSGRNSGVGAGRARKEVGVLMSEE